MILASVMCPNKEKAEFDHGYYLERHIPLVKERWSPLGLRETQTARGLGTPDGSAAPYLMLALFWFDSMEKLQAAVEAHAPELFADIPKITNVSPVVQISEMEE